LSRKGRDLPDKINALMSELPKTGTCDCYGYGLDGSGRFAVSMVPEAPIFIVDVAQMSRGKSPIAGGRTQQGPAMEAACMVAKPLFYFRLSSVSYAGPF
jgi:hypothetical protein